MHANTARGKFHVKSRQSSKVTHHSHLEDTEEMGGTCCSLPMMFMGIYAVLTTLVIAALSIFLEVPHIQGYLVLVPELAALSLDHNTQPRTLTL